MSNGDRVEATDAERYNAVTGTTQGGDTPVDKWGQNPSYPAVLSTTEIRPHAVHRAIRYLTCEVGAFPQYPPVLRTLWNL